MNFSWAPQKLIFSLVALIVIALIDVATSTAEFLDGNAYVSAKLVRDIEAIIPGSDQNAPVLRLGVLFSIKPGWHIYWKNSGESALPTRISWQVPEEWKVGEVNWPAPLKFIERGDIVTYGYKDEVLLSADLFAPAIIPTANSAISIRADIGFLVCNDVCVPGEIALETNISFGAEAALEPSKDFDRFTLYEQSTPGFTFPNKNNLIQGYSLSNSPEQTNVQLLLSLNPSILKKPSEISNSLQLFPERTGGLDFVSSKITFDKDTPTIVLTYSKKGTSTLEKLSGVLVIDSQALIDTKAKKTGPYAIPFETKLSSLPQLNRTETEKLSDTALDLTYRVVSYKDTHAAAIPLTEQSTETPSLLLVICFAFLGGIILNFMPCVLPIISIKVLSYISHAERPRIHIIFSALAYSAGILLTFLTLALVVVSLRNVGTTLGWGFQFQYPEFVLALIFIVFILALGFFDFFHLTLPYLQTANRGVNRLGEGHLRSFFDGILATLLSTPCTAPFLGTALAFAFTAPTALIIGIFIAIGAGLAFPYILLSTNSALIRRLPKPGAWMFRLREIMGFFLLATVIWLLYVLSKLTADGVIWCLCLLLLIFLGFWLLSRFQKFHTPIYKLLLLALIALMTWYLWPRLVLSPGEVTPDSHGTVPWNQFNSELVQKILTDGGVVFIDFTAEWCITCKANEKLVIESSRVLSAFQEFSVTPIKADWTRRDPEVSAALESYGGKGVPYYVVQSQTETIILPAILTPNSVTAAFANARNGMSKETSVARPQ